MKEKNHGNESRYRRYAGAAGAVLLSFAVTACVFQASGSGRRIYGMEDLEIAAAQGADGEELTEAPEDAIIDAATHVAVGALTEDQVQDLSILSLLPEEEREALESLNAEQLSEYAVVIERIVTNPDFQSLMKYEEVQDLVVTLTNDALNLAAEEPEMTDQILETLGVNRNVILVFFELMEVLNENQETTAAIRQFLLSEEGRNLIGTVLDNLDQETIDRMTETFKSQLPALQQAYSQTEAAETSTETG